MSQDPSERPERRTAPDAVGSDADGVDEAVQIAGREREGEYVDKDVPPGDTHTPEHSYVDKDLPG